MGPPSTDDVVLISRAIYCIVLRIFVLIFIGNILLEIVCVFKKDIEVYEIGKFRGTNGNRLIKRIEFC